MEENNEFTLREKIAAVTVGVAVVYSTYQIGRIGVRWTREGVRAFKNRKAADK